MSKRNTKEDFYNRIEKQPNGCHHFIGSSDRDGYKRFQLNGKIYKAHRLALILNGIDIPPGMVVMHHCDNPCCVNPAHLSVGTHSENTIDSVQKGRHRMQKFNMDQIENIRKDTRTVKELASKYNVAHCTIRRIRSKKTYSHAS